MTPGQTAILLATTIGGGLPRIRGGSPRERDKRSPDVVAEMLAAAEAKRARKAARAVGK